MLRRNFAKGLLLAAVMLFGGAGCGGDGGSGGGGGGGGADDPDTAAVRTTMTDLLVAATKNDLETARPYLDPGEFFAQRGSAEVFDTSKMSKEELTEKYRGCFQQLLAVPQYTVIQDATAAKSVMDRAQIQVLTQTRRAEVSFTAKAKEGASNMTFVAKLSQSRAGDWRLITCEEQ